MLCWPSLLIDDSSHGAPGVPTVAEIDAHLQRVLASRAFQPSPRSQEFLTFVVRRALDGQQDSIKERNIAVEVFGRRLGYNSSEDSFVRVKASEVRRRLASYYAAAPPGDTLRIDLPLGAYVPRFLPLNSPPVPPHLSRRPWRFVALALGLAASALAIFLLFTPRPTPLDDFWSPVLQSPEPVIIFLPIPNSYSIVGQEQARLLTGTIWEAPGQDGRRILFASAPHKVGLGAAQGAIRFAALCGRTGKLYTIKAGEDFSFADLRNQPAILFGAFSSKWSVEINNEHRFRLVGGPSQHIADSAQPSRQWRGTPGPFPGTPLEDYAIASRVIHSKSGRIVIVAAGLSTFGTQAAAEFLTDPSSLAELSRRAPAPLSRGNFQVLLHTKVIGNTPSPPKIVDVHFW